MLTVCFASAVIATAAAAGPDAPARGQVAPLNLNLARAVLPPDADDRLVKILLIGDSQMGQSSNRLAGQVQRWNAPFVGRLLSCENQPGAGVQFTHMTGNVYGAFVLSERLQLGDNHGDGNTGSHFHHSRRFSVTGEITPDFSRLATMGLVAGNYTRRPDFDARKNARVAVYDKAGAFDRFRIAEHRGGVTGHASDLGLPDDEGPTLVGDGTIKWFHRAIRPAGELGSPGALPVGITIHDADHNDSNRTLSVLGTLIHDSPSGSDFPDRGLVVSHVSRSEWSAYDHLHRLDTQALDAIIDMNEGFDTVMIVLGHNREDDFNATTNPLAYPINLDALAQRVRARHAALGYPEPGFVMVAPWPIGSQHIPRLTSQTAQLADLCREKGYGFINLFDFFGGVMPDGPTATPRGMFTYTLDPFGTHPADAATATNLMLDIEWSFDPANWTDACPTDLAAPFGVLNFFDLAAYLDLFNATDPGADIAEPFGVVNFFDLVAYLNAFAEGCP